MNWKLLAGFGVILVVFFLGPVAINMAKVMNAASAAAPTGPKPTVKEPPYWNSDNIVGTVWQVKAPGVPVPVMVEVYAGGVAVAKVQPELAPMAKKMVGADTFQGSWSISGATLSVSVVFQNKTQTAQCEINGQRIFSGDVEAVKIR